jgi:hypothetical protein
MILHDYRPRYSDRLSITSRVFKRLARGKAAFFIIVALTLCTAGESFADLLADWILSTGDK